MADPSRPPGAPDPSGPREGATYGFSQEGARRIVNATKRVEAEVQPAPVGPRPRYPIGGGGGGVRFARTTGTIASGSSGSATLLTWNGSAFINGATATVRNPWSAALGSGLLIVVVQSGNALFAITGDCS